MVRYSHNTNDGSRNTQEDDQVKPPESLAVVLEGGLLATANGAILGLGDLLLVGHFRQMVFRTRRNQGAHCFVYWRMEGGEED